MSIVVLGVKKTTATMIPTLTTKRMYPTATKITGKATLGRSGSISLLFSIDVTKTYALSSCKSSSLTPTPLETAATMALLRASGCTTFQRRIIRIIHHHGRCFSCCRRGRCFCRLCHGLHRRHGLRWWLGRITLPMSPVLPPPPPTPPL